MVSKVTVESLQRKKNRNLKIVMMTACSYSMAKLIDAPGVVEMLLVSDRLGPLSLGYDSPLPVTLEEMLHHAKAVSRAKTRAMVVAQMPYLTYEISTSEAARNAGRLYKEGLADAVMLRGGRAVAGSIAAILEANVPVVGHLGFFSAAHPFLEKGSHRRVHDGQALEDARRLEEAGCFAIFLEHTPRSLAGRISRALKIPVIGFGSGPLCDGQMLSTEEMLGLAPSGRGMREIKVYAALGRAVMGAARLFAREVKKGEYLR